jgi:hypothetical protein
MRLECSSDEDGRSFYIKGHIDLELFMCAVQKETGENAKILKQKPEHIWMKKYIAKYLQCWRNVLIY